MSQKLRSVKASYLFSRAYRKGRSVVTRTLCLYALPRRKGEGFSLGLTVSKKQGGAVERNRAKRLMREAARLCAGEKPVLLERDAALILVARHRCYEPSAKMGEVKADLESGLKTLGFLS